LPIQPGFVADPTRAASSKSAIPSAFALDAWQSVARIAATKMRGDTGGGARIVRSRLGRARSSATRDIPELER
jgi:hypothetical protein